MVAETLSLAGKTALVTGSGRENGIGAAIARAFARNGASVAIHYVSENSKARAEKVAADIGREFGTKTTVVQGPVEKYGTGKRMVEQILQALDVDHIDILVNNAGFGGNVSLMEATPEQLEREFGVNTFGSIYLTQAVVGAGKMPKGGRIINTGSIASKLGLEISAVYSAAKAAQDSLTASWAGELGQSRGITVNTLAPGPIVTDLSKGFLEAADGSQTALQSAMFAQTRSEARLGTVEDMADAALLLASEKSRWITAQWISVSGGITGTM
ncbi:L-xylo-3-hexulose reductase [Phialemonium atrogriseum]|uniref:L-xylo-3-hexulose reductase n=1 Tax=Phialemonium atrogriseum TaxID=1093897 RepID=A0AAJ0BSF0_9PEZI|nr:L-xylo-3-hexulose reductase [Phialemonium atrogriseum]KAK1762528.1 L-xylo-3-hexulose reductase [Phialemonium atrogriseum]